MNSDLSLVDHWASNGRSPWHRASALAKIAFVAGVLFAALSAAAPGPLALLAAGVLACLATARVPLGPALLLALYPLLFSSLFVLSRWVALHAGTPVLCASGLGRHTSETPPSAIAPNRRSGKVR